PSCHISDLPILTASERWRLLVEWNSTSADCPGSECIHTLFEDQARKRPDATAVVFKDQFITFGELDRRANQLAHHLIGRGVGPEALVGICVERSADMIVGLLGILKAGGAFLPLDPNYPKERLAFMLEDTKVGILLTQEPLLEKLPKHRAHILCLDTGWGNIARESHDAPVSGVVPDNLAYVIYTSGSTGHPKGVLALHRGALNRFSWMWRSYPFCEDEVCCQKTSLSFVDSIWEIFGPLLQGVKLVIVSDSILKDIPQFVDVL